MKVAIVHDYLNQYGGAEKVVEAMLGIWPDADVYTTIYQPELFPANFKLSKLKSAKIHIFSARAWAKHFYKYCSLVFLYHFESLNLTAYDLIVSSSSSFAKGVLTASHQLHINYCHTPPRFLYGLPTQGRLREHRLWGPLLAPVDNYLRAWDYCAAQRADHIVANSRTTAGRIKKFYRRKATVIYPPVLVESTSSPEQARVEVPSSEYFLSVSRLVRYKNIDLIIQACNQSRTDLIVIGEGEEKGRLQSLAGPTVKIRGGVKPDVLAAYYQSCRGVICAASQEDFGLVPIEAADYGKPSIAYRSGGYKETVIEGLSGVFFDELTSQSLQEALDSFKQSSFDAQKMKAWASQFSLPRFQQQLQEFIKGAISS